MPTVTIRLSTEEKHDLEQHARVSGHKDVSSYVREALDLRKLGGDIRADLDRVMRRLDRLEELAGL